MARILLDHQVLKPLKAGKTPEGQWYQYRVNLFGTEGWVKAYVETQMPHFELTSLIEVEIHHA